MEREVGGGIGMGKTCKLKDVSFQKRKKKKKENHTCKLLAEVLLVNWVDYQKIENLIELSLCSWVQHYSVS